MSTTKPKTLFANFTKEQVEKLEGIEELDYEFGYIDTHSWKHYYPSPGHDYEVLFVNLDKDIAGKTEIICQEIEHEPTDWQLLLKHLEKGLIVAFIGDCKKEFLFNAGIPHVNIYDANPRDQLFYSSTTNGSPYDFIFEKHKISLPVKKYIEGEQHLNGGLIPLRQNRNIDSIAAYRLKKFERFIENQGWHTNDLPTLLLLPQFEDNTKVIADILRIMFTERQDLFPNLSSQEWEEEQYFLSAEEILIDRQIEDERTKFDKWIQDKEKERKEVRKKDEYFIQILKADDQHFTGNNKLSMNVKKVLEFLGFQVEDIDEKIKAVIRKEDYWVIDDDYFALGEVTGTESKNPKIKEFNDILARILTVVKKKGVPAEHKDKDIKGILIINNDRKNHPLKRAELYTGPLEEITESAKEQGISLLSTVQLFKITKAVRQRKLSKDKARKLIKSGGRIETPKTL